MIRVLAASLVLLAAACPLEAKAAALVKCAVGDKVVDRQNRTGTVTSVTGNGTSCGVTLDGGGERTYLMWMLNTAGTPAADTSIASVKAGRYECWSGTGANANYSFVDIVIRDASSYADKNGAAGSYAYDPATQQISFRSGPQMGSYAKYLEAGKIGLSAPPVNFFNMVCSLKG